LARRRLPQWSERFVVGDIASWQPPHRFDYVSTGLGKGTERMRAMLEWFCTEVVEPGGRLILRTYWRPEGTKPSHGEHVDHAAFLESIGVRPVGIASSDPPGA